MKLFLRILRQERKLVIIALVAATFSQLFSMVDPQLYRILVDQYASNIQEMSSSEFLTGVTWLILAMIGSAFFARIFKNIQEYFVNITREKIGTKLYARGVEQVLSMPFALFEDHRSGEILQTISRTRDTVRNFIQQFVDTIFIATVGMVIAIAYTAFVHWSILLLWLLLIPIIGVSTWFISRSIKQSQRDIVAQESELSASATERLRNIELVKSLGLEEQELDRLNKVNEKVLELEQQKVLRVRKLSFIQGTLVNLARAALMFLLLYLMIQGSVTLGEFFTIIFYSFFVFTPLQNFSNVVITFQEAQAAIEQYDAIMSKGQDLQDAEKDLPTAINTEKQEQKIDYDTFSLFPIEFKDVYFKYASAELPALNGVSFDIQPGTSTAFVGPSGSGKSTLMKLLLGLYLPQSGEISLGGVDCVAISSQIRAHQTGFVAQETQLFAGTIADNLRFVKSDATDEELHDVLKKARVAHVVERTGEGLQTRIGEQGIKLSGGERQRIAIARALLRKPRLIIFDEATSSLDRIVEQEITETIEALRQEMPETAVVMIAHGLSTVIHADTIHVMKQGVIVESGDHEQLLATNGLYASLWNIQ